jgi:integrating conjugative element protein (TIGR03757 family)
VLERLRAGGEALSARLKAAFQGALRASAYGIERVPAIVLDHRAVFYGATDASEALARFRAWQGGRDR